MHARHRAYQYFALFYDQVLLHGMGKPHLVYPLALVLLFLIHRRVTTLQLVSMEGQGPTGLQPLLGPVQILQAALTVFQPQNLWLRSQAFKQSVGLKPLSPFRPGAAGRTQAEVSLVSWAERRNGSRERPEPPPLFCRKHTHTRKSPKADVIGKAALNE